MTFLGFLLLVVNFVLFTYYDFHFTEALVLPQWIWLVAALCQFWSHQLGRICPNEKNLSWLFVFEKMEWMENKLDVRRQAAPSENCSTMESILGLVSCFLYAFFLLLQKAKMDLVHCLCIFCFCPSIWHLSIHIGKNITQEFYFYHGLTTFRCW